MQALFSARRFIRVYKNLRYSLKNRFYTIICYEVTPHQGGIMPKLQARILCIIPNEKGSAPGTYDMRFGKQIPALATLLYVDWLPQANDYAVSSAI